MNTFHFHPVKAEQTVYSKTFNIIHKILLVISIYLVFGLLFQHVYANADNTENVDPYQTQHGSVWLLPDNGIYLEAMQMHTDVDYAVTGAIARARVKQQFKNNSAFWAEGIYVFPLPEKAAVDQFKMLVGDRIIEGQVKERGIAKQTYQKAKAAGKKTSLIEQQRPNVFTTSLANIAPGEEITIEFEYQQLLDYQNNSYRLRFPMLVGPRYHPNNAITQNLFNSAAPDTHDDSSVYTETDPVKNNHNPTRIHIMLDAGAPLAELKSTYHQIHINQTSETRYSVSTVGENITANRDFELVWSPELTEQPQLTVFSETYTQDGNEDSHADNYAMVTLLPPDLSYLQQKVQARDVIFVLDISGSMSGVSIAQAKASLLTALEGLSSIDRFNIIWFNHESRSLFPKAVAASEKYKSYAALSIKKLQANGGTEMLPALKLALSNQQVFSRLRQVVFLTDGNISNETELFNVIDTQLGNSRLFTIGIGSAPNAYFMRKAASKGRGTFTYIGDINEVQEKTVTLFKKLETPALINLQLTLELNNSDSTPAEQDTYEVFPRSIPDLYAGEPLTLLLKARQIPHNITLTGDYGNTEWQTGAQLKATSRSGIRIAWAREKIASLMHQRHESHDEMTREAIKQEITDTALEHHLVSRFTSLLAVDVTPVNANGMLYRERMKNNLPHGWKKSSPHKVLAPEMIMAAIQLPQTASSSRLNLLLALLLFISGFIIYQWKKHAGIQHEQTLSSTR